MKILVIGSTGETGRRAVPLLIKRGDEVTAFARNPSAITEKHDRLRVVKGEARDAASIDSAMKGQDAVFVAFGPRSLKKDDVQEALMRNIISAMKAHGVKRIVNLSAWGIDGKGAATSFWFRYLFVPLLLRNIFADKLRGEQLLLSSGLDFVNVRPGRLLKSDGHGGVRASLDGQSIKQHLSYDDLASSWSSSWQAPNGFKNRPWLVIDCKLISTWTAPLH